MNNLEQIHTTIGLYANGSFKINGVKHQFLEFHIEYNKQMRPGRSLFVDGKCVHIGYHSEFEIKEFERKISQTHQWIQTTESSLYQ